MVSQIGSTFVNTTPSAADKSADIFGNSSETYLQLFLAQLKNQDPTQPFDTAQMTEQLAQLNNSQQAIQTNKNLEDLIAMQTTTQASSLTSFINKEVEYLDNNFTYDGAGEEKISYFNEDNFENLNIQIKDANGNIVYNKKGDLTSGKHEFTWDGLNSNGGQAAAGKYTINISNTDSKGKFGTSNALVKGIATGVDFSTGGEPIIIIGKGDNKVEVELSNVASVKS